MKLLVSLIFTLQSMTAFAQKEQTAVLDLKGPQQTAEYIFRNSARDNLISVQLFGSVARPGVYYVPDDTDLMKLLTLAGGVNNAGELREVIVRKQEAKQWINYDQNFMEKTQGNTYQVDVDNYLREGKLNHHLKMGHQDFVYVPQKSPWISNNVSSVITVGSLILSGVLTYLLIRKNDDN